jgi:hypothetical protein
MKSAVTSLKTLALSVALSLIPSLSFAQHYKQTTLVSDIMGLAPTHDPSLVNPWGLSRSSGSPWWVANNGTGTSTLYNGVGGIIPINGTGIVNIPTPKGAPRDPSPPQPERFSMAAPRTSFFPTAKGRYLSLSPKMEPSPAGTAALTPSAW